LKKIKKEFIIEIEDSGNQGSSSVKTFDGEAMTQIEREPGRNKPKAQLPDVLQIRCPSCTKLYELQTKDVRGHQPQFECVFCHCRFAFSFPPSNPYDIQCRVISHSHMKRALEGKNLTGAESAYLKTCPKCAALNPLRSLECYSCGVIFSRVEGLPRDAKLRAQPSLLKKWKAVLADYENQELHEDFLQSCTAVQALEFAKDRYQEMISVQGIDPIGDQILKRIEGLKNETIIADQPMLVLPQAKVFQVLKRYYRAAPLLIGIFLVLIGLIGKTNRNMVGVGITVLILSLGVVYILNGKVRWNDFIR
jgi:ribosomal protein L40E